MGVCTCLLKNMHLYLCCLSINRDYIVHCGWIIHKLVAPEHLGCLWSFCLPLTPNMVIALFYMLSVEHAQRRLNLHIFERASGKRFLFSNFACCHVKCYLFIYSLVFQRFSLICFRLYTWSYFLDDSQFCISILVDLLTGNYRNIAKTVAERYQLQQFANKHLYNIPLTSESYITIKGTDYYKGQAVCIEMYRGEPVFGIIRELHAQTQAFKVQYLTTLYDNHYHAYAITEELADVKIVLQSSLVAYEPFCVQLAYDNRRFICLKHLLCW